MPTKHSLPSQINPNQFLSFPPLANCLSVASFFSSSISQSTLSKVANTNVDYSAAIALGIDEQEEAQAISYLPPAGDLLKSLPAAQLRGTGWILDVLEDLLAFSQENDLPASADSLSKAYLEVAKEIGKNTH